MHNETRITLNEKELPAIKSWQPKKKYKIVLEVEQESLEIAPDYMYPMEESVKSHSSKTLMARFKILKASEYEKDIDDMDSNEFAEHKSKKLREARNG